MEKRHKEEEHENDERWLVSYADFITLLMVFFVVMYSLSRADAAKFEQVSESLRTAFGNPKTSPIRFQNIGERARKKAQESADKAKDKAAQDNKRRKTRIQEVEEKLKEMVKANKDLDKLITIQGNAAGTELTVRLADSLLFQAGRAELTAESLDLIGRIAGILTSLGAPVNISGHTDSIPISNDEFSSNWELSTARSTSVIKYLVDNLGIPPAILSASGYAEHHPIAANDTPENRAKNRRVEFVITESGAPPADATVDAALREVEPAPDAVPVGPIVIEAPAVEAPPAH